MLKLICGSSSCYYVLIFVTGEQWSLFFLILISPLESTAISNWRQSHPRSPSAKLQATGNFRSCCEQRAFVEMGSGCVQYSWMEETHSQSWWAVLCGLLSSRLLAVLQPSPRRPLSRTLGYYLKMLFSLSTCILYFYHCRQVLSSVKRLFNSWEYILTVVRTRFWR